MSDSTYISLGEVSGVDISHDNTSIGKSSEQFERYVKGELTILLPKVMEKIHLQVFEVNFIFLCKVI